MAVAHVTLATRDLARTAAFFAGALGWRPIVRPNNVRFPAAWLEIAPGQELHLLELPDFAPSPFEARVWPARRSRRPARGLCRSQERLARSTAQELIAPDRPTPFERFFFRDPDGYVFEVVAAEREPERDAS